MGEARHYPKAPITEAIIDLRVEFAEDIDAATLKRVGDSVLADYPQQEELFEATGQFDVRPGIGTSTSVHQHSAGYKASSADKKQILQSRRNGFTFSRLAPYDRWETFRNEARRLWKVYRETTAPSLISRLALRYVNRIDIPYQNVDLKDYFRTSPEIAPELPQELAGFFMQLQLPCPELNAYALLNQTTVPPAREGVVSVVLDVDLFRTQEPPQDEQAVWDYFETLHRGKNEVFEACITDSTRKLFELCPC